MLRYITRALAACASIAAFTLFAPSASAQFREHPLQQRLEPNEDDIGPNVEGPEEPAFGQAVAIRSGLAFIGMPARTPSGRVGVFTATTTELIRTGTITPSDSPTPGRFSGFGRTLTYRDGILVVGSQHAAYVFTRNGSGVWTQRQKITPPAADGVFFFAESLRYEDGTLAIGADTSTGSDKPGSVYIYQRNSTGQFAARGKLTYPDSEPGDAFGVSISTAGATMVVGAPGIGRAYVFNRNSSGVWRYHQTLVVSDGAGIGAAVAIDRGMIIVGAPFQAVAGDDSQNPHGAAYGFISNGSIYVETFKLQPRQPDEFDGRYIFFGRQIAMFDGRIVVGAQRDNSSDGQLNGTAVFTYTRSGSSVTPRGVALNDFASNTLALADQRLLVGQACNRISTGFCPGNALFYRLNVFQ